MKIDLKNYRQKKEMLHYFMFWRDKIRSLERLCRILYQYTLALDVETVTCWLNMRKMVKILKNWMSSSWMTSIWSRTDFQWPRRFKEKTDTTNSLRKKRWAIWKPLISRQHLVLSVFVGWKSKKRRSYKRTSLACRTEQNDLVCH